MMTAEPIVDRDLPSPPLLTTRAARALLRILVAAERKPSEEREAA
jgi:hypothetical protein